MKVLFISGIPSPYRVDFFNELSKYCNLTVIYEKKKSDERDDAWILGAGRDYRSVFLSGIRTDVDKAFSPSVISYLKKSEYDLVIVHGYISPTAMLAIEYLKLKKIKFCIEVDGGFVKQDSCLVYRIKRHFMRSAQSWFSTGKACDEYLMHYGAKQEDIYQYPFTSIRNCKILSQSLDKRQKENIKSEIGIQESRVVLSVGRFVPGKGFDILIKAAAKLEGDIGIYMIGGQPTEQYLEGISRTTGCKIHFFEFMNQQELQKYYMSADVFVLPTREDIWGLVVNEAMAFGLPVITTNKCVAGLELIENGTNGYLYETEDSKVLAQCIQNIVFDEPLCLEIGNNNIKKIKNYTIETMAVRHMEIFSYII